jgi:putative addiction module killer protein
MLIIEQTDEFSVWLKTLRDIKARTKISARLKIAQSGNLGDCEPVGEGVSEMRIHFGPGYRLYLPASATSSTCC